MIRDIECPYCNIEFEVDETPDGGECPLCRKAFLWEYDCEDDDALLIPDWNEGS